MIPHSIRWRLTLSYAAIALLAALALGLVLLTTLRSYYQQREKLYLVDNAQGFTPKLAEGIKSGIDLQSQVEGLAFVIQARIRLFGPHQEVLADSGVPRPTDIAFATFSVNQETTAPPKPSPDRVMIIAINKGSTIMTSTLPVSIPLPDLPTDATQRTFQYSSIKILGPTFGLGLQSGAVDESSARSDQVINGSLYDSTGTLQGYIELSDGPAYGVDIVNSAARSWALAGVIAIILAALAGWIISRRISQPIVALTDVTARMADGDLSTRANMARDDELGMLARSFNEMADQVEDTITTLRRFVSDAAHELHSPLTALQTDLELSAGETDGTQRRDLIARAQAQVARLRELTSSLLDLSRLEAAGTQPDWRPFDLGGLVRELIEPYASQADQAGLTLVLTLPPEPIEIKGQADQLRRAIGNLIDNAIKFTPEGGTVTIDLQRGDGSIGLCVSDTGIGIPADDLPQLFSRFHRGRNAAGYPGNGLGLAIVKAIVEAHGGAVGAENTAQGTRFCITFPHAAGAS